METDIANQERPMVNNKKTKKQFQCTHHDHIVQWRQKNVGHDGEGGGGGWVRPHRDSDFKDGPVRRRKTPLRHGGPAPSDLNNQRQ